MERCDLKELHYITPIDNVPSILKHGILSYNRAKKVLHRSVAMQEIQELRTKKKIPGGMALHDYANLYFTARNPMLYKRRAEFDIICVLAIDPCVLDLSGVVITDGNAASKYTRPAPAPGGLEIVKTNLTFAESWTDTDQITEWRKKNAKFAEVLVPNQVEPDMIKGAYVGNRNARKAFSYLKTGLQCDYNRYLFFR